MPALLEKVLAHVPHVTWFLLLAAGLWSAVWDAADAARCGRARDARFARIGGLCYLVLGVAVLILKQLMPPSG